MEIPPGNDFVIYTRGESCEDTLVEKWALHYGMQLKIRIGPDHPRSKTVAPLTFDELTQTVPYHEPIYSRNEI